MSDASQTPTPMTLEEAMQLAVALLDQNRLAEAEPILSAVLQASPQSPDGLHFLGILRCQQGRADEGIELIRQAIAVAPTYAEAHHNLGNIFRALNRPEEALASFQRSIELAPNLAQTHLSMADILRRSGRRAEAVPFYLRALALDPSLSEARFRLGKVYYRLGETDKAQDVFREWQRLDPESPIASHMVAAIGADAPPDRASDGYVRAEFEDFANTFDEVMATLGYNGPQLVASALAQLPKPTGELDVLDAGCGTGLVGPVLRPFARRLIGVDLSPAMLDRARQRGLYDELGSSELTAYLTPNSRIFDLIVCADTLIYFGDLSAVFRAVARALRPGGYFIFTNENLASEAPNTQFLLQANGRYAHREEYVRRCLDDAGLLIRSVARETIRLESKNAVEGLLVVAALPP